MYCATAMPIYGGKKCVGLYFVIIIIYIIDLGHKILSIKHFGCVNLKKQMYATYQTIYYKSKDNNIGLKLMFVH